MTGKILTSVAAVAAICLMAMTSSAHDGFPMSGSGGCGCGANGHSPRVQGFSPGFPPVGGCTNGECGNWHSGAPYNSSTWSGGRNNVAPLPGTYVPRSTPAPSWSPFFDSQPTYIQPYDQGRSRLPAFQAVPSFGSGEMRPAIPNAAERPAIPTGMEGIAQLSPADQVAALQQRTCPVTQEPLGSMGKPIRVSVAGRSIFVCCEGCVTAIQRNPQKYLQGADRSNTVILR